MPFCEAGNISHNLQIKLLKYKEFTKIIQSHPTSKE